MLVLRMIFKRYAMMVHNGHVAVAITTKLINATTALNLVLESFSNMTVLDCCCHPPPPPPPPSQSPAPLSPLHIVILLDHDRNSDRTEGIAPYMCKSLCLQPQSLR